MEPATVDERLLARLTQALVPRAEILEAYLFGSHARGQARPDSDVDVAVYVDETPILLYHRVLRDGVRLLSRDLRATTSRAGHALSRYFDFLPQLDKMDAARRFASGKGRS